MRSVAVLGGLLLIGFGSPASAMAGRVPAIAAAATDDGERYDVIVADAKTEMLRDPRVVLQLVTSVEHLVEAEPNARKRLIMQATLQWLRGEALIRTNEVEAAAPIVAAGLTTVAKAAPNSSLHGDLLLSSGDADRLQGKVASALSAFQHAFRIFQRLDDTRSQAKALYFLGSLYVGGYDNVNALKYFDQALKLYKVDAGLHLALYNNRGNILKRMGRFDEAERQYADALALARKVDSPLLVTLVYCNVAEVELAAGRVDLAEKAISAARRLTTHADTSGFRKQLDALAAQAAYQRHDLARAADLLDKSFSGVDLHHTTSVDREAHRTAYEVYEALGRNESALRHLAALKRIDDEATDLARSTNAALMGARFDFANQELKIAKLRQDELARKVANERERIRSQRLIFFGAAGATLIIIAILLYALRTSRRARTRVQAANDDLAVTNDALGQALAAKTEFLATTSHEIRTPLNGILGMTQVMLIDDKLAIATRDRLKVVHEAGVTMRALVDDILDVAKMETGNLTIEQAPFDLHAMLVSATNLWTAQAEAKGLSFIRTLDDCPAMICGDAARVRQVVFNLVGNALKFTAEGSVSLAVTATDDRYRIAVRDSGIGIPLDKHEAIFESFRQADTSTTRQFGGTGLGLSICRNLARAMGGDVSVESIEGQGATFTVDLPLIVAEATASEPCATPGELDLLIVDRNPITRSMLKTLFAPHLANIAFAPSVAAAIERVGAGGVGHVLADDATVRLGDALPDLTALCALDTAVTLLWPVSAESEAAELTATGIALLVAKPVTGAALVEKLLSMLQTPAHRRLVSQAA